MFEGVASADKDPRKSLHVARWPCPSWPPTRPTWRSWPRRSTSTPSGPRSSSRCPPSASSTGWARRASGGPATPSTTTWSARTPPGWCCGPARWSATGRPGDQVTVHCNYVDDQDPSAHDDSMLAANQRIWGFESNFGGLADIAVVKANQLMPKPTHLSWEEAAVNALCNSTAYRMLVSHNGAAGDPGRPGAGLGGQRGPRQLRRPVRAERRRHPRRGGLLAGEGGAPPRPRGGGGHRPPGRRLPLLEGRAHPGRVGVAPVRQGHPGAGRRRPRRSSSSIPAARPWGRRCSPASGPGTIVTCAATSGYMIEYDNRHLWMKLKTIKGSHFANYREAWDANRLVCEGKILPPLSAVFPLVEVGEAAYQVHRNLHEGKIGVLCLAPAEGLGHRRPGPPGRGGRGPDHPVPAARGMSDEPHRPADRDRPRGHRRPRPRRRHRPGTRRCSAPRWPTGRWSSATGSRRPCCKVADSYIQLLTPVRDDSPVAKFLATRGEGLHHVGYRVADCAAALQAVKDHGGRVIDEAPRPGSRGTTVAFVHPKTVLRHPDRAGPGVAGSPPASGRSVASLPWSTP